MEKVISCLYRGKRRRRLFLFYKEGGDGEGDFLFIRGKRRSGGDLLFI